MFHLRVSIILATTVLGALSTCAGRAPTPSQPLPPLEQEILAELNRARRDPPRYARETLAPLRRHFSGRLFSPPGEASIRTTEGIAPLEGAIDELSRRKPLPELSWSRGLALAAADHLRDQGKSGRVGHVGGDGSEPTERMSRHGRWLEAAAEAIEYGSATPTRIVASLVIDDGVEDRGHRRNLFSARFRRVGVASGRHPEFRRMTVIDLAGRYEEKDARGRSSPPPVRNRPR